MKRASSLLILVLAATGCWSDKRYMQTAVWADDDQQFLLVESLFEQNGDCQGSLLCTTNQRNFRVRYYLEDVALSGGVNVAPRRELGGERPGRLVNAPYLMRTRGYAVLGRGTPTEIVYEKIAMDGSAQPIATAAVSATSTCPALNVVPSPDGALLAVVRHDVACAQRTATVEFRNASTLALAHAAVSVSMPSLPTPTAAQPFYGFAVTWTPAGAVVFSTANDASVPLTQLKVVPGQTPQPTTPLGCVHPETRSSEISSTGHVVYTSDNKVQSGGVSATTAFGCQ